MAITNKNSINNPSAGGHQSVLSSNNGMRVTKRQMQPDGSTKWLPSVATDKKVKPAANGQG